MIIELTKETMFGEPGPNLCWFVSLAEIQEVVSLLDKLISGVSEKVSILPSARHHLFGIAHIEWEVSENGNALVKVSADKVVHAKLPTETWEAIRSKFSQLDEPETFDYVEFDDNPLLVEEANWIVECRSDEELLLEKLTNQYMS